MLDYWFGKRVFRYQMTSMLPHCRRRTSTAERFSDVILRRSAGCQFLMGLEPQC